MIDPANDTFLSMTQFAPQLAERLGREVTLALTRVEGLTITNVQVKQIADGSGRWAVFASGYDGRLKEHDYRIILNDEGEVDEGFLQLP